MRIRHKKVKCLQNRYSAEINLHDKKMVHFYAHKRAIISVFDIIAEKIGTRFNKYKLHFRTKLDYKFKKMPVTYKISGITNIHEDLNKDITPYCYNDNGKCPFWRHNYSTGVIFCDAYTSHNTEIDNSNKAYVKAYSYYKTTKKMDELSYCMALFDQVDICGFKYKK
jgi:hypothetical protein